MYPFSKRLLLISLIAFLWYILYQIHNSLLSCCLHLSTSRNSASLVGDDIDSQPGPSVGPAWVDNVAELVTDVSVSIPLNFQTWHRSSSSLYIVVELVILADLAGLAR